MVGIAKNGIGYRRAYKLGKILHNFDGLVWAHVRASAHVPLSVYVQFMSYILKRGKNPIKFELIDTKWSKRLHLYVL